MDIKEKLLQEEIKRAKVAPSKPMAHKRHIAAALVVLTLCTAAMLFQINTLDQENKILESKSQPTYQHINTITYPDPICRDELIVTFNGESVCGVI